VAERLARAFALAMLLAPSPWVLAKEAAPAAQDPALEQRVMLIAAELRCLVCQNQTIADSNAELAADLRNQVREKVRQGQSDGEIIDFMVARYGDFVLYRPPFKATTLLLWLGPLLLLATGLVVLFWRLAHPRVKGDIEVAADERERARRLLAGSETGEG
jgi:cytochrome c-type biogenesis protein CcmH